MPNVQRSSRWDSSRCDGDERRRTAHKTATSKTATAIIMLAVRHEEVLLKCKRIGAKRNAIPSPKPPPRPLYTAWLRPRSLGGNHRARHAARATKTEAAAAPIATHHNTSCVMLLLVAKPRIASAMRKVPVATVLRLPHRSDAIPQGSCASAYA